MDTRCAFCGLPLHDDDRMIVTAGAHWHVPCRESFLRVIRKHPYSIEPHDGKGPIRTAACPDCDTGVVTRQSDRVDGRLVCVKCAAFYRHHPSTTPKEPIMRATVNPTFGPLVGAAAPSTLTEPAAPTRPQPTAAEMISELTCIADRGEREVGNLRELVRRVDSLLHGDKPQPVDNTAKHAPSAIVPLSVLPDTLRRQASERDILHAELCDLLGLGSVAKG